ncbi:putative receptor protein kinase ZmPK1 [Nymphaea colorata]|nr:putative receptor protein kinase ZmPK1 [Nymphaea colorata]
MGRRSWRLAPALLMAATAGMLFAVVSSQQPSVLKRGSSLSVERFADDVLISEGGTFKTGFYPVGDNAFAFAVWFTEPANGTVVWMANRDRPVNGRESRLEFRSGQVALIDADGSIVWATNTSDVDGVVAEQMEIGEDGNLVVRDRLGKALWESFDFPTDTLLAFQGMTRSKRLVSRRAAEDYSSGPYQFLFDDDNVLSFLYEGSDLSSIYWPNPDMDIFGNGRTRYNSTKYASFDDLGRFTSSDNLIFSASDVGLKNKRRLTMDYDGVLRLYSLNSTTKSWEVTWLPVLERCRVHGLCGENGICFYNPEPECTCPPGFSMKNRTDWTQGCQPNSKIVCNDSRVQIVKLPHTDFYGYDMSTYKTGVSFEACKNICTSDCKCRGFGYRLDDGSGSCYPKNILFNGQTGPNLLIDIYIKVSSVGNFNNYLEGQFHTDCSLANLSIIRAGVFSSGNVQGDYLKLPVGFVIAIGLVEIICLVFGWAYLHKELGHIHNIGQGYTALRSGFKRFTYKELKRATKNFSSEIGRGGSGVVYKGVLEGEVVAIKRLEDVHHGEAQFWSEVSIIGRINHINLLRLLGFCFEKQSKLLVYEFMENGSLEKNLFNSSSTLAWDNRFNIALGTAKGLAYLHEECLEWVLHCDIKPQNILLDKDFTPKVADFGLSKLLDRGGTNVSSFSRVRGTRGYMAPEWILNQPITSKVDVYSYGILVLEMVTGRSSVGFEQVDDNGEIRSAQLIPWVREMVGTRQQWIEEIADPSLSGIYDKLKMEILVKVALKCVGEERDARPTMSQVVDAITLGCQ